MRKYFVFACMALIAVALVGCPLGGGGPMKIKAGIDAARSAAGGGDLIMVSATNVNEDGTIDVTATGTLVYVFRSGSTSKQVSYSQAAPDGIVTDYSVDTSAFQVIDAAQLKESDQLATAAKTAGATFPATSLSITSNAAWPAPIASFGATMINAYTAERYNPGAP